MKLIAFPFLKSGTQLNRDFVNGRLKITWGNHISDNLDDLEITIDDTTVANIPNKFNGFNVVLKDDLSVKIITSGSVFSLPGGHYYCAAAVANMPNSSYGYVEVATWENEKIIKVYDLKANANIYLNTYANGAWAGWTVK